MNKLTVDFQQVFEAPGIPSETQVQKWAQLAWQGEDPSEVTVRIVGTEESQALNHQYRGRDYPTNVLSFPAFPVAIGDPLPPLLGDVGPQARHAQQSRCGVVVQLVRTPACHAGGREFESRRPRQFLQQPADIGPCDRGFDGLCSCLGSLVSVPRTLRDSA